VESKSRTDRIFQSTIEWWKTVYDFYKHLITIALASIAAFGALLGGAFRHAFGLNAGSMPRFLVIGTFIAFALTAIMAVQGMHYARRSILHMRDFDDMGRPERYIEKLESLREYRWWKGEWRKGRELFPKGLLNRKRVWFLVWFFYTSGILAFILFLFIAVIGYGGEQQTNR
jgi:hypothetical protein